MIVLEGSLINNGGLQEGMVVKAATKTTGGTDI
jgi:hypothetical protein